MSERTFHHGRHELHGITVVVETRGTSVWVGRCDDIDGERVILLDADMHEEASGDTNQEWIKQAARYGVWKRHDRVVLPRDEVVSVARLGDVAVD